MKEAYSLGKEFFDILFGNGMKEGIASWEGFGDGLRSLFRGTVDFIVLSVQVLKAIIPPVLDMTRTAARLTGFDGVSDDRRRQITNDVNEEYRKDPMGFRNKYQNADWSVLGTPRYKGVGDVITERLRAEPGSIDMTLFRVSEAIRNTQSVDAMIAARNKVWNSGGSIPQIANMGFFNSDFVKMRNQYGSYGRLGSLEATQAGFTYDKVGAFGALGALAPFGGMHPTKESLSRLRQNREPGSHSTS